LKGESGLPGLPSPFVGIYEQLNGPKGEQRDIGVAGPKEDKGDRGEKGVGKG